MANPRMAIADPRRHLRAGRWLAVLALVLFPMFARAHPGQTLEVRIRISADEVRFDLLVSADLAQALLLSEDVRITLPRYPDSDGAYRFKDPAEAQRVRQVLEDIFITAIPVVVDGEDRPAVLAEYELVDPTVPGWPAGMPADVRMVLVHPLEQRPKQVAMAWTIFPDNQVLRYISAPGEVEVLAELDAFDENKLITFTEAEPEYIWHAPRETTAGRVNPVLADVEPARISIPLLSVGLIGVGLVMAWSLWRRFQRVWPRAGAVVLVAVASVVAVSARSLAVVGLDAPWSPRVTPPTADEAARIFKTVQQNVYRAFDKKTESDIYDTLALSVDGELLDDVYNEVYQSLILRDQGGAVARVKGLDVRAVDVESTGVVDNTGDVAFRVLACWRVHGAVYHWGHVHARTNEHRARCTLAQRGGNWKIVSLDTVEQRRIVQEGDDPPSKVDLLLDGAQLEREDGDRD